MSEYREFRLGKEAIAYVQECLSDHGHTLSKFLLAELDLQKGAVFSFLPEDIAVEDTIRFDSYGITSGEISLCYLVGRIQDHLRSGPHKLVIFEDAVASPTDPGLESFRSRMFVFGNELYHYLAHEDSEEERIRETVSWTDGVWPLIGAMTSLSPGGEFPTQLGSVTEEDLRELAKATKNIIVGAYDAEGYLIWSKGQGVASH